MTNGEKLKETFPNVTIRIWKNKGFTYIGVEQDDAWIADFNINWWNSEYKEIPTNSTNIEVNTENYNNNGWCNTCEYKHLESECLGCAKYDEYDNLIALSHYKKESEE